MTELKPFINLLRRAAKSRYDTVLMNNRMLMQCYTIDRDEDVGLHYILHIPDIDEYASAFYDETLILNIKMLLTMYGEGHKALLDKKKKVSCKAKDVKEELYLITEKRHTRLKFVFTILDEIVDTKEVQIQYPVVDSDPAVENIMSAYWNMMLRIKDNGVGLAIDCNRYNLYNIAVNSPVIYFWKLKIRGVKLKVPFYKSMFGGKKSFDEFFISIQETTIPSIYVYTIQLTVKGLTEQYVGYLQNF